MNKLLYLFLLLTQVLSSQISIFEIKVDDGVELYGANLSDGTYEVDLNIKATNMGENENSILKNIPPLDTLLFAKLSVNDQKLPWTYTTQYNYRPNPTEKEKAIQSVKLKEEKIAHNIQLKAELLEHLGVDKTKEVVLFYGTGCPRSEYAKVFLEKKKIPFKLFNVTENEHYGRVMWQLIKLEDSILKSVQQPVLLANEEMIYNMANMRYTLNKTFKKKR